MFDINKKAQVSIEIIIIIGIIVIAGIIFASFYLGNINKNINYSGTVYDDKGSTNNWISSDRNIFTPDTNYTLDINSLASLEVNPVLCGDGSIQYPEECDGVNFWAYNGYDCQEIDCGVGDLFCDGCKISTSSCSLYPSCQAPIVHSFCGNGVIDDEEDCEDTNWGMYINGLCSDRNSFYQGNIDCVSCNYDFSNCSFCGNNIVEGNEECDGVSIPKTCTDLDYNYGSVSCNLDCTINHSSCVSINYTPFNFSCYQPYDIWRWLNPTVYGLDTWTDLNASFIGPITECMGPPMPYYYFLHNSITMPSIVGDPNYSGIYINVTGFDRYTLWVWPDKNISKEILEINQANPSIIGSGNGWSAVFIPKSDFNVGDIYSIVLMTNSAGTSNAWGKGMISVRPVSNIGGVLPPILNTNPGKGWCQYVSPISILQGRFGKNNSCTPLFSVNQTCGNNIVEGLEKCDGTNLGVYAGKTCSDLNSSWVGNISCDKGYCAIGMLANSDPSIVTQTCNDDYCTTNGCFDTTKFMVRASPYHLAGYGLVDVPFKITLNSNGLALDSNTVLYVSRKEIGSISWSYVPTQNCKLIESGNYSSYFDLGFIDLPIKEEYYFDCNSPGDYAFRFMSRLRGTNKLAEDYGFTIVNQ